MTWAGVDAFPPATLDTDLSWIPDPATMAFKYGAEEAIEATGNVVYEAAGLPFGVVINNATGALSGRPREAGVFSVTVLATKVSVIV